MNTVLPSLPRHFADARRTLRASEVPTELVNVLVLLSAVWGDFHSITSEGFGTCQASPRSKKSSQTDNSKAFNLSVVREFEKPRSSADDSFPSPVCLLSLVPSGFLDGRVWSAGRLSCVAFSGKQSRDSVPGYRNPNVQSFPAAHRFRITTDEHRAIVVESLPGSS